MPEVTEYAPGTPSWVDLASTDVDAAKPFYERLFGWTYDDSPTPDGGTYTMAMSKGKPVCGIMAQPPNMAGMPSMWSTFVSVEDVDASIAAAEAAGGSVNVPAMDVMDAGRMAVLQDPTGAVICLWQPQAHIGAHLVNEHGALTWTDLMTNDKAAAAEFYGALFGWDATVSPPMPNGGTATMFGLNGGMVASAGDLPAPEVPPHWHVFFAVDDADAAAATITEAGGQVVSGPFDTPPGRMVVAADPTGGSFSVIQLNPDFVTSGA
jgi:predicted enzyme related to lactoylglutathione lyase